MEGTRRTDERTEFPFSLFLCQLAHTSAVAEFHYPRSVRPFVQLLQKLPTSQLPQLCSGRTAISDELASQPFFVLRLRLRPIGGGGGGSTLTTLSLSLSPSDYCLSCFFTAPTMAESVNHRIAIQIRAGCLARSLHRLRGRTRTWPMVASAAAVKVMQIVGYV